MAASCYVLLREPEVGENKMSFSPMCFCPHCRFHSCLITLGGPTNKVICWSPTVVCLSLLSISFSADLQSGEMKKALLQRQHMQREISLAADHLRAMQNKWSGKIASWAQGSKNRWQVQLKYKVALDGVTANISSFMFLWGSWSSCLKAGKHHKTV